jgi:hypothetical protein
MAKITGLLPNGPRDRGRKTLGLKTGKVSPNFQGGGESPFADLDAAASLSNQTPRKVPRRMKVTRHPILPRPCRSIE